MVFVSARGLTIRSASPITGIRSIGSRAASSPASILPMSSRSETRSAMCWAVSRMSSHRLAWFSSPGPAIRIRSAMPAMPVMGPLRSWETVFTKSFFICSRFLSSVMSRRTAARPTGSPHGVATHTRPGSAGPPPGEEQGAERVEAAADRHDQGRPQACGGEHAFEIGRAVLGGEILDEVGLARADRPTGEALVRREHPPAHRALLEVDLRVHEVAAPLGILETDGEVVAGHGGPGLVAERLEKMARDRRAGQLGEGFAEPGHALELAHTGNRLARQ